METKNRRARGGLGDSGRLLGLLSLILLAGFGLTSAFSFRAASEALHASMADRELPAAADTIYERIQRDLLPPVFVSSMMADDSFLHDWILGGESDLDALTRYLGGIQAHYGAFTVFFVSERSRRYYIPDGILKTVSESEPRDAWYFRVRAMDKPYELNLDPDLAHGDQQTVFINYRVVDAHGEFLGAAGVGINVASLGESARRYQEEYGTSVFFADGAGRIIAGSPALLESAPPARLADDAGLSAVDLDAVRAAGRQAFDLDRLGSAVVLNVKYLEDLDWFVLVERALTSTSGGIRAALWINLGVCLLVIGAALVLSALTVRRFQSRLEHLASVDRLTGIMNRHAFEFAVLNHYRKAQRDKKPFAILMLDLDDFKRVNDTRGHAAGDATLVAAAKTLSETVRGSDLVCRWGGEEFLVALPDCVLPDAVRIAEKIRAALAASASVGVTIGAALAREAEDFHRLAERADEALLRGKRAGKNRVVAGEG